MIKENKANQNFIVITDVSTAGITETTPCELNELEMAISKTTPCMYAHQGHRAYPCPLPLLTAYFTTSTKKIGYLCNTNIVGNVWLASCSCAPVNTDVFPLFQQLIEFFLAKNFLQVKRCAQYNVDVHHEYSVQQNQSNN